MRQTISVAICVIVSLVIGAIATRYIHPHWILATLHSLQLHALVACIVAICFALVVRRHFIVWSLLVITALLMAHTIYMTYQFAQPSSTPEASAPRFRLLTINALNTNFANGEAIARMIAASGADIVNLMEGPPLHAHMTELEKVYPYRVGCGVMTQECDQVLLSKTPLEKPQLLSLSNVFEERFIVAKTMITGREIFVSGIHTTKPYFDNFHWLELHNASSVLREQTRGPLLLSGDFNASSLAPNMQSFLKDTGLRTNGWEPATWPTRLGSFGMPIDHVYVRDLRIVSLTRQQETYGSNHFSLMSEIAFVQ